MDTVDILIQGYQLLSESNWIPPQFSVPVAGLQRTKSAGSLMLVPSGLSSPLSREKPKNVTMETEQAPSPNENVTNVQPAAENILSGAQM